MNAIPAAPLVRRLAPADAAAYRALMLDGYAGDPEAFTATVAERAPLPLAFWEARLARGDGAEIVFGALAGEQLVGALGLAFEQRPKLAHKARLFGMYVAPRARLRGLGRLLVEAALDAARRRGGINQVLLTVIDGNPAPLALYTQCGFAQFGIEPQGVRAAAGFAANIHMWRPLPS
jgi:GNAT superfamily N-acetyltransferase